MFSYLIVFAWLCLCFAHAYTVHYNGDKIVFPIQEVVHADSNTFARIHDSTTYTLRCPRGFTFNNNQLKCISTTNVMFKSVRHYFKGNSDNCPPDYRGTLPNPLSCRSFYNCWDGNGYLMPCNEHLLYNERTFQCDWPKTAGCCEYQEKDSSLIVQSS